LPPRAELVRPSVNLVALEPALVLDEREETVEEHIGPGDHAAEAQREELRLSPAFALEVCGERCVHRPEDGRKCGRKNGLLQ